MESSRAAAARASLRFTSARFTSAFLLLAGLAAASDPLTEADRIEIIRGLTSEYATVKDFLPRSKKPLDFDADGTWSKTQYAAVGKQNGPAARVGDLIQVTRVTIEKDRLLIEINGGIKNGGHWYDHVEVGSGTSTRPMSTSNDSNATSGTNLQLLFHEPVMAIKASEIKEILSPLLDFDKHSATELYSQHLPPRIQKAIAEKRAEEGMDREMVLMALGKPERKLRESKEGVDYEDWIFGRPPGKIVFVTFSDSKVVKVKQTYAGLGAEASKTDEIH